MNSKKNIAPKVTICVVTYNQENYIAQSLQSIVDQKTDFDFEVIVSDDCSTDRTPSLINTFVQKYSFIKLVLRDKNIGALKNFVETHNMAKGEYVCHLDGDDIWLPSKIQKQFDFLEANPEFTACWTKSNFFNDSGLRYDGRLINLKFFGDEGIVTFDKLAQVGAVAMHSSLMYRRAVRKTYDTTTDKIDLFYSLEYLLSGNGKILSDVLTDYRVQSSGAITRNSGTKIKRISASHISYYVEMYPIYSSSFFVFCFVNLVVDLKNNRDTKYVFLRLALKTFSLKGVANLIRYLPYIRNFKIPRLC